MKEVILPDDSFHTWPQAVEGVKTSEKIKPMYS